ncbi:carbohydrate ABC transporter permease [Halalkalibacter sp. APA_J-10(15)]|uniref:carbohydrate ABC transporter permease n=1 Tax=unclassified Halalkalibacter TaxID=2893063 RepID=UPI001FF3650C|nr:sugar ABC transporter permease [Halalkalibacter sp. APA_J-10(15)]MCK0471816.1 sugar ABC transporter permease [Halalkalibacter sp. APA_J-10(15)]
MERVVSSEKKYGPKPKRTFVQFLLSKKVAPYVFVSPFIISFLLLFFYPLVNGIIMSFQSILPGQTTFVGSSNFERILNPTFYRALYNTSVYVILTTIILVAIPMVLATILNSSMMRFSHFFRASLFIPALTSVIVAGVVFRLMFGESDEAIANAIIGFLGFEPLQWRYGAVTGMFLMVILASWRWIGVNIIYFMAGLTNVPKELYEAAEIDGAGVIQKFFHITLPLLKPVTIYVVTLTVINGFRMYEESFVFWENASPGNIGLTVVGYIYQQGFQMNNMGFGSAIGVVLMAIIFIVSIIQLKFFGALKKGD